jgi:hypothetical protein
MSSSMIHELPTNFPPLPPAQSGRGWPANYLKAHQAISDLYSHAIQLLRQDDCDTSWIAFYISTITSDALPLLEALENEGGSTSDHLPMEWLHSCAMVLG